MEYQLPDSNSIRNFEFSPSSGKISTEVKAGSDYHCSSYTPDDLEMVIEDLKRIKTRLKVLEHAKI